MKIMYLMGKSSSGKDTIYKILKTKLDVNLYVLYTTRPIRTGEQEGVDYRFLTENELEKYNDKIIESRTYQTVHGPWTYATILDEQFDTDKDLLMTGTLESYIKVKEFFEKDKTKTIIPIYIEVEDGERLTRALAREKQQKQPKYKELCRRFLADSEDFSEENLESACINVRFENNNLEECLAQIKSYIRSFTN